MANLCLCICVISLLLLFSLYDALENVQKVCLTLRTLSWEECWTIFVVSVLLYHQSCHVQLHTCIWLYFIRTNLSVCRSVYRCVYSPSNKIVNIYASNLNRFRRYHTDFVLCFMFRTYSLSLFWSVFLPRNVSIWLYVTYICVSCFKTLLTRLLAFHLVLFSSLAYICCFHDFMRSFWNLV